MRQEVRRDRKRYRAAFFGIVGRGFESRLWSMKKSILLLLVLCSCSTHKGTIKDLVKVSYETGRLRQEIAVKTVYPNLDWTKIDSVYQTLKQ